MLVAPARAGRPHDVAAAAPGGGAPACPFCPGNEGETPPETMAVRPEGGEANGGGWLVRAVPNKFPALAPDEGVHEVIVNTPRHVTRLAELTGEEAGRAVAAWAERVAAVARDPRGLRPFLFLNQGAAAGASLQHSHAQLVGLPFDPPRLVARERAFAAAPACPVCADIASAGVRLVAEGEGLVAWCPEVPPLSGTVRIAPARHVPDWESWLEPAALGRCLRDRMAEVERAFGESAANLWLHQRRPGSDGDFHWHVDAVPRLGTLAGLELGAGVIAAPRSPAEVAARLREVALPA